MEIHKLVSFGGKCELWSEIFVYDLFYRIRVRGTVHSLRVALVHCCEAVGYVCVDDGVFLAVHGAYYEHANL